MTNDKCLLIVLVVLLGHAELLDGASRDVRRQEMVRNVDERLSQRWKEAGIEPGAEATDGEFLRRVYLDLSGVIPRVSEARAFLQDQAPDKRARLIDQLLSSPRHATHLANTWREMMLPDNLDPQQLQNLSGFQNWLRRQFLDNLRYDRVVSDLLVSEGGTERGPALYFTALDVQPEKIAANTARVFLGVQIECAQCHDHPFDRWTQEDFWGFAAFFAQLDSPETTSGQPVRLIDLESGEVRLPGTGVVVPPKFLQDTNREMSGSGSRRIQLAIWMASRDNPYLARATVNRVWAILFGRGLVHPVDDLGEHNPASHPELLDELTQYFVSTGFDLRELFRTLANTAAYQKTSRSGEEDELPPELFARMAVKTMTADQLYDSLHCIGMRSPTNVFARLQQRRLFSTRLRLRGVSATDFDAGLPQALILMNGEATASVTTLGKSDFLAGMKAPFFTAEQRVETLFLATLSRPPRDDEKDVMVEYIESGGAAGDAYTALGDVLWALLNSGEFLLNH